MYLEEFGVRHSGKPSFWILKCWSTVKQKSCSRLKQKSWLDQGRWLGLGNRASHHQGRLEVHQQHYWNPSEQNCHRHWDHRKEQELLPSRIGAIFADSLNGPFFTRVPIPSKKSRRVRSERWEMKLEMRKFRVRESRLFFVTGSPESIFSIIRSVRACSCFKFCKRIKNEGWSQGNIE